MYAIGEIILVVIGILIALQINNWNEDRKIRSKEQYYLNSIKTSIALSQDELNRVIKDAQHISSCADTLFFRIAAKNYQYLEGATLDSLLFGSGDYSIMSLNEGGIREILNTGSLNVIRDKHIREILASWDERMHKIRKFETETQVKAYDYKKYLEEFVDFRRALDDRSTSIIIPEKKDELLNNPYLANHLVEIISLHQFMNGYYSQEKMFLDSLNSLIDAYVKR